MPTIRASSKLSPNAATVSCSGHRNHSLRHPHQRRRRACKRESERTTSTSETAAPDAAQPTTARRPGWFFAAALALAALLVATFIYRRRHTAPRLHLNDAIILAPIQNNTGEAIFDDTLYQALRVKFNESPFFTTVSERAFRAALAKLNRTPGEQISLDDANAACAPLKAQAVISGSVALTKGTYEVTLLATPCGSSPAAPTRETVTAATPRRSPFLAGHGHRPAPPQTR